MSYAHKLSLLGALKLSTRISNAFTYSSILKLAYIILE